MEKLVLAPILALRRLMEGDHPLFERVYKLGVTDTGTETTF